MNVDWFGKDYGFKIQHFLSLMPSKQKIVPSFQTGHL